MEIYLQNVLYLLWREEKDRNQWPLKLGNVLGCSLEEGRDLLQGKRRFAPQERGLLLEHYNLSEEDLFIGRLFSEKEILMENIAFLIKENEIQGAHNFFGVHASTVSKWKNGSQEPSQRHLEKISDFFGIPASIDLRKEPVFLSLDPLSDLGKKNWLKTRVDGLSSEGLRQLFPALKKLLEEKCT